MTLYERIGDELVRRAITVFYERAFADGVLAHFFFGKDRAHITSQQVDFAASMLGGPTRYRGKPLGAAHKDLAIRGPHFARRQVLMREVLVEVGVPAALRDEWLAREESLRSLIVNT